MTTQVLNQLDTARPDLNTAANDSKGFGDRTACHRGHHSVCGVFFYSLLDRVPIQHH